MKVYAHYNKTNDIEYRWRTLLQIGESWEICGTVIMKNPGSSFAKKEPIEEKNLLENLRKFDDNELSLISPWFEFTEDNTMTCVKKLFDSYYSMHQKQLIGVIQIFNLFNIRDANLVKAIDKSQQDVIEDLTYTVNDDIKHIVPPVYIGWGDLWKAHRNNAEKFFSVVRQKTSYLCENIESNKYYHPQFLMNFGKRNIKCQITLAQFLNNTSNLKMNDYICHLFDLQKKIESNGTINRIVNCKTLTYEYFCKGNGNYRRENGTVSVGLTIEDEKRNYLLKPLSYGNHPDKFGKMISDICESKGWIKSNDNKTYSANISEDDNMIIDFMTFLLKEMKKYRETDLL